MKNSIIISLSGFFLAVLCTTAKGQVSVASGPLVKDFSFQTECVVETGTGPHNKPGQNVLRNFERKFENVSGARWYESSFGFVIKFNIGGIDYRVDLDKNGNWLRTIRSYEEMKLPEKERRFINHSYNGYSISFVREIELPFQPLIFVVNLEGKNDIIQVRISGEETEEFQKISKPHADSFTSNNRN